MEFLLPGQILKRVLYEKSQNNPSYSLRALARDLDVSHSYLSKIISGKRKLSIRYAARFSRQLRLPPQQTEELLRVTAEEQMAPSQKRTLAVQPTGESLEVERDRQRFLSEWYHAAILEMTSIDGFPSDAQWVARRLHLKTKQVKSAVTRLERLGLLKITANRWERTHDNLFLPTRHQERSVRQFHRQMIEKALAILESPDPNDFNSRDITGSTIATNPVQIAGAKRMITKFRKRLMQHLSQGKATELYQVNIQLFDLTKPRRKKRRGTLA
jgi:uncharacterized protein (TIGR02147 family)